MIRLRLSYVVVVSCLLVSGSHTAAAQRHRHPIKQQIVCCGVMSSLQDSFLTREAGLAVESKGARAPADRLEPRLAPGKGAIRGTVTDATGKGVSGAKLTATNEKTNQSTTVTAGERGEYFLIVPAGTYTLLVIQPGLKMYRATKIVVTSQEIVDLPIRLLIRNMGRNSEHAALPFREYSAAAL